MVKGVYSVEVSEKDEKKVIWEVVDDHMVEEGVEDPDEEEIYDVVLDEDKERHWRIVFEDNNGGVDGTKALLHANK